MRSGIIASSRVESGLNLVDPSTLSGRDRHFTFTTPEVFTGTEVFLYRPPPYQNNTQTYFAVVKLGSLSGEKTICGFPGTGTRLYFNAGKPTIGMWGGNWGTAGLTTASTLNTWQVIGATRGASPFALSVWRNGETPATGTGSASDQDRGFFIGGNTTTPSFVGEIYEIILFDSVLSESNRTGVNAFLMDKYGIG